MGETGGEKGKIAPKKSGLTEVSNRSGKKALLRDL